MSEVAGQSRISIAMAVYNGERFIREQLDSFVCQTRLPDELVVSDNASTDSTIEIVREFASRAPFPVRLFINDRNLGVAKNFERAIGECAGDIIFLSDCDDVWYPIKIEALVEALEQNPRSGLVVCDADLVDAQLRPLRERVWKHNRQEPPKLFRERIAQGFTFRRWLFIGGCCMAIRAKFKSLFLPLPAGESFRTIGHDYFIASCIVCSGAGGIAYVPIPLLAYRQHPGQTSRLKSGRLPRVRARKERPNATINPLIQRLESVVAARYCVNPAIRSAALRHWRARVSLPAAKVERIGIVAAELLAGRYHRFSGGLLTAIKDLLFVQ